MNIVSLLMAVFSVIGALDLLIGDKFGIGKEFQKGFKFFGELALSMIGMIVLAPVIADVLEPISNALYNALHIDPSVLPSMIFASDMGGGAVASEVANNSTIGYFNGLIVASMMGCTVSFTIPYALNTVKKKKHKLVLFGFLCGIATIPIGVFIAGIIAKIPIVSLLVNIVPIAIFALIIIIALLSAPKVCVKVLGVVGYIIKSLIIIGLILGIVKFFTGYAPIKNINDITVGAEVCFSAALALTGVFPFMFILSKIIKKPMQKLATVLKVKEVSAFSLFSCLAVSMTTFDNVKDMDDKGIVLNSAFAVSAAFVLADHLVFTLSVNDDFILPLIAGKIISGISAVLVAIIIYNRNQKKEKNNAL